MQGIYTYIPETNYVPRKYSVAAILLLLFMLLISLVPVLNLLYFHISTFRSMCVCSAQYGSIIIIIIIIITGVVISSVFVFVRLLLFYIFSLCSYPVSVISLAVIVSAHL